MATYRIVVTELPPDDITPEPWAVEWTNQLGEQRHVHHSKAAAQQHVRGLLQELAPGLTKKDALTVRRHQSASASTTPPTSDA